MINFFLIPTTKKFSWKHVFEVDATSAPVLNYLQVARDALSGLDKASAPDAYELLESYSPHVWSLFTFVMNTKNSGGSIYIKRTPEIKWQSTLTKSSNFYVSKSVYLETAMVFFGKASTTFMAATSLVKTISAENYEDVIKNISSKIKKAAAIWQFTIDSILSNITSLPEEYCPELSAELCEAMISFCAASLDEITVTLGLLKGSSPALLAKIAASAAVNAQDALFKLEACPINYLLCNEVTDCMAYMVAFNKYRSFILQAMDTKSRGNHGEAVGYCKAALEELKTKQAKKVSSKVIKAFNENFKLELEILQKNAHDIEMENNHIYYQIVPDKAMLNSSEVKSIANFDTMDAPNLLWTNLKIKSKKSKADNKTDDKNTVSDTDFLTFGEFINPNDAENDENDNKTSA